MSNLDLIRIGLRNLWRRKLRTFLTVLGVLIGVTSIVVMVSFGLAMSLNNEKMLATIGDVTTLTVRSRSSGGGGYIPMSDPGKGMPNSEQKPLNDAAVSEFRSLPKVRAVMPILETSGQLRLKKKQSYVQILGVNMEELEAFGIGPSEGRLPLPGEKLAGVAGFYLEESFWDPNQNHMLPPKPVDLLTNKFDLIIGDYYEEPQDPFAPIEDSKPTPKPPTFKVTVSGKMADGKWEYANALLMPQKEVEEFIKQRKAYDKKIADSGDPGSKPPFREPNRETRNQDKYSRVLIKAEDITAVESLQEQLKADGFVVESLLDISKSLAEQTRSIQLILGGIGAVSLLVAAIGIMNTMVMSIYERTKEIGVMKVIGASVSNIRNMFLLEASLIGLFGGILGSGLSLLASRVINNAAAQSGPFGGGMMGPLEISYIPPWLILVALVFSMVIGVLSGYYPAVRATKLSALEAMRTE